MKYYNNSNYNEILAEARLHKKNKITQSLCTGDLIKVKSDYHPFVSHYGIVERLSDTEIYIIHNHPDRTNKNGGNVLREDLNQFLVGKEILSVKKTDIDLKELKEIYEGSKQFKYDFFHFNCEHFVNFVSDREKGFLSPQVIRYTSIAVVSVIAYWYFRYYFYNNFSKKK